MIDKEDAIITFQIQKDFWIKLFPLENLYYDTYSDEEYCFCEIIDELLYAKYEDGSWELGYHFRYGPLDYGMILEIERLAAATYALLKNEWTQYESSLFCTTYKHYSETTISVGWNIDHLAKNDLSKIYEQAKFLSDHLDLNLKITDDSDRGLFGSNMHDILNHPLKYLSLRDLGTLRNSLGWAEIALMIEYYNYHSIFDTKSVYNRYTDGKGLLIISDILEDFDDDIEVKMESAKEIQFVARLKDFILLKDDNNAYLCHPELYTVISKLVKMLDAWEDSKNILFFITPQKEILIYNQLFLGIQPIYILDSDEAKGYLVTQELARTRELIEEISEIKFVDTYEIINSFRMLVTNAETTETEIQNFIHNYYQILLGKQYSKVYTEVVIDYEDESEPRRMDIVAFDTARKDWDIYELKRGCCGKTIIVTRGIPSFSAHVNKSLAQVYEYRDMLVQREIKRQLAQEHDINIKNPQFFLLIGYDDSDEWNLCCGREKNVSVKSYKYLIDKAMCGDRWTSKCP